MLVAIQHTIRDPQGFWTMADKVLPNLPANIKLVSAFPSPDGKTCNCLWESPSVSEMQAFMDKNWGSFATNFCYEVDSSKSIGL